MKSINVRFAQAKQQAPNLGDTINLGTAVKGQSFSKKRILLNFNKLVNKNEYELADKTKLINNLYSLSKTAEEGQIGTKFAPGASQKQEADTVIKQAERREELKACIYEDYVTASNRNKRSVVGGGNSNK